MARVPLADIPLAERIKQAALSGGNAIVVKDSNDATATVYSAATGTGTITNSQTIVGSRLVSGLDGWVESGEYSLSCGGAVPQKFEASSGDAALGISPFGSLLDDATGAFNYPFTLINSVAVASTDNQARYIRLVPSTKLTAAKVVIRSGSTAAGTITATKVALYESDGTTLTRLAINTTNTTSGLLDSINTRYAQALNPATNVLIPGKVYYIGVLVDATTAGTVQGWAKTSNVVDPTADDGPAPMYTLAAQTDLDTTEAISGLTAAYTAIPHVGIID